MTSTLAQGVGRSPGEPVSPLRLLAPSPALLVLLLGGLAVRLTIAYVLLPSSGFETDLATYASWAATMAAHGPAGFYANAGFADYPPAYLYVLWLVGLVAGPGGDPAALIKLPPILIDIGVGYLLYRLVRGWTRPGQESESMALLAAALYVFNPVTMYDSALWGQTDAAGALVVLLGVAALIRGNSEGAAALAVAAALVKPQFGVLLLPLVAAVLLKRHLLRAGSGPRHRPWAPSALARWLTARQGPVRLLTALLVAVATFLLIALPYGMGPLEYLDRMLGTAGGYDYLTVNAYNLWALVATPGQSALVDGLSWTSDTIPLAGPIPGVAIGATLLAAGFLWGVVRAAVRDDRWTLIVAAAFLAIAFFILPTRAHERYVFPAVALLPLLAVVRLRWTLALVLLSTGALINLHGILTLPLYATSNVASLPLGEWFRTPQLIALSALLQTGVGLWVAWQLRPVLVTSPDAFEVSARTRPGGYQADARPPRGYPAQARSRMPVPGTPVTYPDTPAFASLVIPARWYMSRLDQVVARLSWGSLRRDRGAALHSEPGGRLDRRDLFVLSALVAVTLLSRGVRLDQPVHMYFDEVYHARTAMEFMQDWRYGQPHDIYEFTHPHLAKYAMALGIEFAGGNEVTAQDDLGVSVRDAALEPRWSPLGADDVRAGDHLYVATGSSLRVYDPATRGLLVEVPVAATALALDAATHELYMAEPSGRLFRLQTTALDELRRGQGAVPEPVPFASGPGAPVERLFVADRAVIAVTTDSMVSFDPDTGQQLAERADPGTTDLVAMPSTGRLLVDATGLTDRQRSRMAERIAAALDSTGGSGDLSSLAADPGTTTRIAERLAVDGPVDVAAYLSDSASSALQELIDAGDLPGASIEQGPMLARGDAAGITVLDARTLDEVDDVPTDVPVSALLLVDPDSDQPTLYAATGDALTLVTLSEDGLGASERMWMPGEVEDLTLNASADLVHATGVAPDGGQTVYAIEPRGRSVFIDVPLPFEPRRVLADTLPGFPQYDRTQLLAISPDGQLAAIAIGGNAFGWRLPGLLMGALTAALIYLLVRLLFARRTVALIAAVLVVAEGMLFANSRIGMNDVYVTAFILLAAVLFTPIYLGRPRPWTAVLLLLGTGLALGLALASKWVGLYAMGGLGLLVLLRSALGRAMALLAMMGMTAVLGALAIRAPPVEDPARNWIFVLIMLLLCGLLVAGIVRRPLAFSRAEVVLAVAGPILAGVALALAGSLRYSSIAFLGAAVIAVVVMLATLGGRGPFARGASAPTEAPNPWLHPGSRQMLPWILTLTALTVIPIVVYVLSYAPWVALGNAWGLPILDQLPFLPHSTPGGQTLIALTEAMYHYHDTLRATHAASSPWWAWPFDLKPVWFFQDRYSDGTTGLIYDAGNLVVFWLGIAGLGFSAWAAWTRRSLSLALVVIMWAALWLPWSRIDRATFQYHVYASLPFVVVALSYLLAELWHGPSARVWFLARTAAAVALVAAPVSWLLRTPLCILAGTAIVHPDGAACATEVTRTAEASVGGMIALLVLGVGAGSALAIGWRASRAARLGRGQARYLAALGLVALATVAGVGLALALLETHATTSLTLSSFSWALLGLALVALPAWLAFHARDPRRFVLGVLGLAVVWFVIWYPNIAGLPLPNELAPIYQGLLPTWNWDFQFAVNTDPPAEGGLIDAATFVIGAITAIFVIGVAIVATRWDGAPPPGSRRGSSPAI